MAESESRGHIYIYAMGGCSEAVPQTCSSATASELPKDQQWVWVGRDRRVSVRLTASMWAEVERRAAELCLPWSAVLRHALTHGLKSTETTNG